MNQEHPDEVAAKRIIETSLRGRLRLDHADKLGGVDYLTSDGAIAVEVTRVTDGDVKKGRDALKRTRGKGVSGPPLRACWPVIIPEKLRGQNTIRERLYAMLADLEAAGETRFDRQHAAVHVLQKGPLTELYLPLLSAGIEVAEAVPHVAGSEHVHKVIVSAGGGGSASGSDDALARLTEALSVKTDNPKKLAASGAKERHLFVWIDGDTPFGIERPLSHYPLDGTEVYFGLPSGPPDIDPVITHLWIVHERSGRGWYWDGASWHSIGGA